MGRFEHVSRERKLGAKGAREPQRRGDRSGGDPARRGVSADLQFLLQDIEAAKPCLLKRMAPRGFVETPLSFRRQHNSPREARFKHPLDYNFLMRIA